MNSNKNICALLPTNDKIRCAQRLLQDVRHDLSYFVGDEKIEHAFEILDVVEEIIVQFGK